jgi:hypothetical protein
MTGTADGTDPFPGPIASPRLLAPGQGSPTMFRTRLAGAALITFIFLPGCGILCGDRPRLCERWRSRHDTPVSFPGDAGCGTTVIPPNGGMMGAPIMIGPGGYPYGETLPQPGYTMPNIPKAGIIESPGENKGKQFDPDRASRTGPVLMIPANGSK